MNVPSIACEIEVRCAISPSEDPRKIGRAISNVFPGPQVEVGDSAAVARSPSLAPLERIFEVVHSRHSQRAYRRNLLQNSAGTSSWFYLNRQAAFAGRVAICERAEESPLGPIRVTISSPHLGRIIDWLAPGGSRKFDQP